MNDPLSPFNVPPPRYLLESDSSDEEGQGIYGAGSSKPRRPAVSPSITVEHAVQADSGGAGALGEVMLGVGQAGKYLLRKFLASSSTPALVVRLDSTVVGRGYKVGGALVLSVDAKLEDGTLHDLANKLLEAYPTATWTVLSIYVPAMYIPTLPSGQSQARKSASAHPPIRYLSTNKAEIYEKAGVEPYTSPNYTTGLPGALLSLSAHPSSPTNQPLSVLLLPLPLSSLSTIDLGAALNVTISSLSVRTDAKARWTEDDDEPYAAPGMGGGRQVQVDRAELSSMYT